MAAATPVAFPNIVAVEAMMVELGNARCKSLGIGRQDNFNAIIHRPRDAHHNASTKAVVGRIYQHRTYSVNKPNGRIIWIYERTSDNKLFLLKPRKGPLAYKVWQDDQTFSTDLWLYGQNWLQAEKAAETRGQLDLQQWLRDNRPQDAGTSGEYLPYKAHIAKLATSITSDGAGATIHVAQGGTTQPEVSPTHTPEDLDAAQALLEISRSKPANFQVKKEGDLMANDAAVNEASGRKPAKPATKKRSTTSKTSKTSKTSAAKDKAPAPVTRTTRKRKATADLQEEITSKPSKASKTSKKDNAKAPPARTTRKRKATEVDLDEQTTSKASKTSRGKKNVQPVTTEATTTDIPTAEKTTAEAPVTEASSTTAATTDTTAEATSSKAKANSGTATKTVRKRKATDADLSGEISKEPPAKKSKAQHTTTKRASKRKVADADLDKEIAAVPAAKKTKVAPVKKTKAASAKKDVVIPSRSSARITQRQEQAAMNEELDEAIQANSLEGTALGEHMKGLGIDLKALAKKVDASDKRSKMPPRLHNASRLLENQPTEEQQHDAYLDAEERRKRNHEYCTRLLGFDGYQFPTSDVRGEEDPNFKPLPLPKLSSRRQAISDSEDIEDGDDSEATDLDDLTLTKKNARKPTSKQSVTISDDDEDIDREYSPTILETARKLKLRLAKDKTSDNPEVIHLDAPAPKKTGRKITLKKTKKTTADIPELVNLPPTPPPPARYIARKPTLKYSKRMALNLPEAVDANVPPVKDNANNPTLTMSKISTMYEYGDDGNKISGDSHTHDDSAVAVKAPTMAPTETPFKAYEQSDHRAKPDVPIDSIESDELSKPTEEKQSDGTGQSTDLQPLIEPPQSIGSQQPDVTDQTTESGQSPELQASTRTLQSTNLQPSTELPSSTGLQSSMDMHAMSESLGVNETGQATELHRTIEAQHSSEPDQPSEIPESTGH